MRLGANGILGAGWYVVSAGLGSLLLMAFAWLADELTPVNTGSLPKVFGVVALALVAIGWGLATFGAWRA